MRQENYDVVIVGSGIGGLCAGALLAHGGYKVLVTEKLPRVGGKFDAREYKGFKIANGAAVITYKGPLPTVFERVGAEYHSHIRTMTKLYFRIGGKDIEIDGKGAMRKLITEVADSQEEADRVLNALHKGLRWQKPSHNISLREWLSQYTSNEKIIGIFWGLSEGQQGLSLDENTARHYFDFITIGGAREYCLAVEGLPVLSNELVKVIRNHGGDVWLKSPAQRILIEDGLAKGVVVQKDGEEIEILSQAVVSNSNPRVTVELAGRENFDIGYLRELRERSWPSTVIWIHATADRPFYDYQGTLTLTDARKINLTISPTNVCPEWAPPGKHYLIADGAPVSSVTPIDIKKEIEMSIIELKENFPVLKEHGEILLVQTFRGRWPAGNTLTEGSHMMPQKTPVELLYNVGDAVCRPGFGGTYGAADTALTVTDDLKERIKPMYA